MEKIICENKQITHLANVVLLHDVVDDHLGLLDHPADHVTVPQHMTSSRLTAASCRGRIPAPDRRTACHVGLDRSDGELYGQCT